MLAGEWGVAAAAAAGAAALLLGAVGAGGNGAEVEPTAGCG
jgi:hypothetical protein